MNIPLRGAKASAGAAEGPCSERRCLTLYLLAARRAERERRQRTSAETLLRLLLPLNDKVRVTSRLDVPFPEATIQSENLTGPFNR